MRYTREEVRARLQAKLDQGKALICVGAGTALVGQIMEEADCDMIFAYCTGEFRMDGYMSMYGNQPFFNCDETMVTLGKQLFRVVKKTPIICGIGAGATTDVNYLIDTFTNLGYSGIINVPLSPYDPVAPGCTAGIWGDRCARTGGALIDAVKNIETAHKRNVFTCGYGFTEESLRMFAGVGADMLIPHLGFTSGGSNGSITKFDIEQEYEKLACMVDICRQESPDAFVLVHGGLLATPADVELAYRRTKASGFVGASSTERLPVETGMKDEMIKLHTIRKKRASSCKVWSR